MGTSTATKGARFDDVAESHTLERRKAILDKLAKKSLFEKIWYIVFILAGLMCLVFVRPFTYELVFAVSSMFIFMVSENLIANGNRFGFIVSLCSSTLYVIDCIIFKVYGEVAINLLLYMPIAAYSFFSYKRAEKKEGSSTFLEVRRLKFYQLLLLLVGVAVGGVLVSLILNLLSAEQSLLNSLSVVSFVIGMIVNAFRFMDTWYFDILGNTFNILMWVFVSTINLSSLPFVISSLSALIMDFYGIYYWRKLHKKSTVNGGIILAKRKINISKVIKLKRQFRNLKWNRNIDNGKNP